MVSFRFSSLNLASLPAEGFKLRAFRSNSFERLLGTEDTAVSSKTVGPSDDEDCMCCPFLEGVGSAGSCSAVGRAPVPGDSSFPSSLTRL